MSTKSNHDFMPDPDTTQLAKALYELVTKSRNNTIKLFTSNNEQQAIELSDQLSEMLQTLLEEIATGNPLSIVSLTSDLSTQQAADILNVSRPYFVKLLEQGELPFHYVGKHRRVKAHDVIQYKRRLTKAGDDALDELVAQAQLLDMGYKIDK